MKLSFWILLLYFHIIKRWSHYIKLKTMIKYIFIFLSGEVWCKRKRQREGGKSRSRGDIFFICYQYYHKYPQISNQPPQSDGYVTGYKHKGTYAKARWWLKDTQWRALIVHNIKGWRIKGNIRQCTLTQNLFSLQGQIHQKLEQCIFVFFLHFINVVFLTCETKDCPHFLLNFPGSIL